MSNTGWICPRCQKVHAPFVQNCGCVPLPDLIGKPLPLPTNPDQAGWRPPMYPMPVCGCTGPCGNAACPHRPKITCATIPQFSVANSYGDGGTVV